MQYKRRNEEEGEEAVQFAVWITSNNWVPRGTMHQNCQAGPSAADFNDCATGGPGLITCIFTALRRLVGTRKLLLRPQNFALFRWLVAGGGGLNSAAVPGVRSVFRSPNSSFNGGWPTVTSAVLEPF